MIVEYESLYSGFSVLTYLSDVFQETVYYIKPATMHNNDLFPSCTHL